jgi:hypothetical protein
VLALRPRAAGVCILVEAVSFAADESELVIDISLSFWALPRA